MPSSPREILNIVHQALLEHRYLIEGDEAKVALTDEAIAFIRKQIDVYDLIALGNSYPIFNINTDVDYAEVEKRLCVSMHPIPFPPTNQEALKVDMLKAMYGGKGNSRASRVADRFRTHNLITPSGRVKYWDEEKKEDENG